MLSNSHRRPEALGNFYNMKQPGHLIFCGVLSVGLVAAQPLEKGRLLGNEAGGISPSV